MDQKNKARAEKRAKELAKRMSEVRKELHEDFGKLPDVPAELAKISIGNGMYIKDCTVYSSQDRKLANTTDTIGILLARGIQSTTPKKGITILRNVQKLITCYVDTLDQKRAESVATESAEAKEKKELDAELLMADMA